MIMGRADSTLHFSAVVPLYCVEPYLPELLDSLSAQAPGDFDVEYIFVDDGSPDRSGDIAEKWLADTGARGQVIRQANAGVSAARNRGLAAATGDWVTFPDSDDVLSSKYFRTVASFITRHGDAVRIVATRLLRLYDADDTVQDVHALQFRFAVGDRRVSMVRHPDFFQMNAASAFFRRDEIERLGVEFPVGVHASEDALFVADFLLRHGGEPTLGLVAGAHYIYRRRATADSAVDRSWLDPHNHIARFHDGYLPLMERAAADGGVPVWLQSMFLYECQWMLPAQVSQLNSSRSLSDEDRAGVLDALAACAWHVDEKVLFEYDATALPLETRLLLQLLAGRDLPDWVGAYRAADGVVDVPAVEGADIRAIEEDGSPVEIDAELVAPDYFGQQLLWHWRGRIPDDARVMVDGAVRVEVTQRWEDTAAQQRDRHRRSVVGWTRGTIPSREDEVRVWKPVPGPFGSPWHRARWRWLLWRRRYARMIKRMLRMA